MKSSHRENVGDIDEQSVSITEHFFAAGIQPIASGWNIANVRRAAVSIWVAGLHNSVAYTKETKNMKDSGPRPGKSFYIFMIKQSYEDFFNTYTELLRDDIYSIYVTQR